MKSHVHYILIILPAFFLITACGLLPRTVISTPGKRSPAPETVFTTQRPYVIHGKTYYPLPSAGGYEEEGIASWYGRDFHGRKTACGENYDMYARTAAHKTLPMNTYLLVKNFGNGKETVVRVNDRGPFVKGRIIDLSLKAAQELDLVRQGTARVRITALGEAFISSRHGKKMKHFLPHGDFETGEFYVQIGSFTNPANARRLRNRMRRRGDNAVIQVYDNGYSVYYRVRVYAGKTLGIARQRAKTLDDLDIPGIVVAR